MKKVLILYRFLPHYRIEFYNGLKKALEKEGVELNLVYGKTNKVEALRNDEVEIPWAKQITNRFLRLGKIELLWQPCFRDLRGKDLVIVEGANKLIINYWLMIRRKISKLKLGVWGHGLNLQIEKDTLRNKFKTLFLRQCDSYFAYTEGIKELLVSYKMPESKVVVVKNSIETKGLRAHFDTLTKEDDNALKAELGMSGENIGVFCGGMYPEKRIDFILEACQIIKSEIKDFHLIFIGSGVDSPKVKDAAEKYDWIKYVGPKLGVDRVKYFKISSLQIMPGLVGLGVLDSFVFEAPLITTHYPFHSPEIEYLENNVNGVMTENTIEAYSSTVIDVLKNKKYLELNKGCVEAMKEYTIENMVNNFKDGIVSCLNS